MKNKKKTLLIVILIFSAGFLVWTFFDFYSDMKLILSQTLNDFYTNHSSDIDSISINLINGLINSKDSVFVYYLIFLFIKIMIPYGLISSYFIIMNKKDTDELKKKTIQFDTIAKNIPGGVCCYTNDANFTITYLSESFLELTGYDRNDINVLFDNKFIRMIYPSDRNSILVNNNLEKVIEKQYRIIRKDGSIIWIFDKRQLLATKNGETEYYCVLVDISKIKRNEQELVKNQKELQTASERYRIVSEQTDSVIFEYDIANRSIICGDKFRRMFGYDDINSNYPEDIIEQGLVHPDDIDRFIKFYADIRNGVPYCEDEYRLKSIDDVFMWFNVRVTTIFDENGKPVRAIGNLKNISRNKNEKLRAATKKDIEELTGLLNYSTCAEFAKHLISYNRPDFHALILLNVDSEYALDNPKYFYAMKNFCNSLKVLFRSSDIVGTIDENTFLIFLKSCSEKLVLQKSDEIMNLLSSTYIDDENKISLKGNLGIALYPDDDVSFERLYKKAQLSLNEAINRGLNSKVLYHELAEDKLTV